MKSSLYLLATLAVITLFCSIYALAQQASPDQPESSWPLDEEEPIITVPPEHVRDFPAPTVKHKHAIFFAEDSCKLKNQFIGARRFLHLDAGFYPDLSTHLVFGGKPRIKFYELDEDFKKATVAASEMTHEQMLEILQNLEKNPNYYDPVGDVTEVLLARETTTQDIKDLLAKFNIQRGLTFDISKRPVIHETGDSDPNERKFSHDDVLRDLDPEWDHAEPPSGYDYEEARRKRDTAGRAQADKAAAEYAERKQRQMLEEQAAAAAAAALKEKKDEL